MYCVIHEKECNTCSGHTESMVCEQNTYSKKISWTFFLLLSYFSLNNGGRNVCLKTRKANQFICKFDLFSMNTRFKARFSIDIDIIGILYHIIFM